MIDRKEMMELMFSNLTPSPYTFPGCTGTLAEQRLFTLIVFLHLSDEESLDKATILDLVKGGWDDLDEGKIARGFIGSTQVNMGNRYAASLVAEVLTHYNGSEVASKLGELLQSLENHLISVGALRREEH